MVQFIPVDDDDHGDEKVSRDIKVIKLNSKYEMKSIGMSDDA